MTKHLSEIAIGRHIKAIYSRTEIADNDAIDSDLERLLIDNVFVVTMNFGGVDLNGSRSDPSTYLNVYGDWYRKIMQQSFGNNLGRKRWQQPISYAFIDFPGSRYKLRHKRDLSASLGLHDRTVRRDAQEYLNGELLHVHAIVALIPERGQACRSLIVNCKSSELFWKFGNIDVASFDPAQGSLENMIAYCKKGSDQLGSQIHSDCWQLFPR